MNSGFFASAHRPNDNDIGNAIPCVVYGVGLASLAHDNAALFKGSIAIIYVCYLLFRDRRVQFF